MSQRVSNEEIVTAYKDTGSVWKAAKRVGLSGQSVQERLASIGHPRSNPHWLDDEVNELKSLVGKMTIGGMASTLGRPYSTVATKLSDLRLSAKMQVRHKIKRGTGFDKKTVKKHIEELGLFSGALRQYCRKKHVNVEALVKAIQRHFPDWWKKYVAIKSDLELKRCVYCNEEFIPFSTKQQTCSRRCQSYSRFDRKYFSGNRKSAVGMAEGICQLCSEPKERLSAHHLFGKENDTEDKYLIALCAGCHNIVTMIAGRTFCENPRAWENLINIVLCRRAYKQPDSVVGILTTVDLEFLTDEEFEAA